MPALPSQWYLEEEIDQTWVKCRQEVSGVLQQKGRSSWEDWRCSWDRSCQILPGCCCSPKEQVLSLTQVYHSWTRTFLLWKQFKQVQFTQCFLPVPGRVLTPHSTQSLAEFPWEWLQPLPSPLLFHLCPINLAPWHSVSFSWSHCHRSLNKYFL